MDGPTFGYVARRRAMGLYDGYLMPYVDQYAIGEPSRDDARFRRASAAPQPRPA
jgi:hypothetical protein